VDAGERLECGLTIEEARRVLGLPPPHTLECELLVTGLACTCREEVSAMAKKTKGKKGTKGC
jgi:hypothetical protein